MTMRQKELLFNLIEKERAKLNRLIDQELRMQDCSAAGKAARQPGGDCHSEAVYHQSRYLDRLIELYMECA